MIVFHIQAVMDSPDHSSWQLGLLCPVKIRASESSSISTIHTFVCHFYAIIATSGWVSALFVTSGWKPGTPPYIFLISDFIILHLILTPLSLSPSCRRPVPLKKGPRGIQHRDRRLRSHAPLCLLKGEPIAQHKPEPRRPQFHQCRPCICQGERVYPSIPQRQPPQRCQRQGPFRRSSLPTSQPSFPPLRISSPSTAGFPPSAMTSTPPRSQCWRRPLTRRSRFT